MRIGRAGEIRPLDPTSPSLNPVVASSRTKVISGFGPGRGRPARRSRGGDRRPSRRRLAEWIPVEYVSSTVKVSARSMRVSQIGRWIGFRTRRGADRETLLLLFLRPRERPSRTAVRRSAAGTATRSRRAHDGRRDFVDAARAYALIAQCRAERLRRVLGAHQSPAGRPMIPAITSRPVLGSGTGTSNRRRRSGVGNRLEVGVLVIANGIEG
jgi:hypothetical protein